MCILFVLLCQKYDLKNSNKQTANPPNLSISKIIHPDILNALLWNKSHIHFPITLQISQIHQQAVFVQDETAVEVISGDEDEWWQMTAAGQTPRW